MGLARRAEELRHALELLTLIPPDPRERLANGALAVIEDEEGMQRTLLVLPGAQGDTLHFEGTDITVLSLQAPMLKELHGKREGDVGRVRRGERWVEVEIIALE